MGITGKMFLQNSKKKAEKNIDNKEVVRDLLKKGKDKSLSVSDLKGIRGEITVILHMIKDFVSGSYKGISKKNIVLLLAGIIYLVNPLDLVPDFILGLGYLDDLSILGYLIKKFSTELSKYKDWAGLE